MTTIQIKLPEDVARQARAKGLLAPARLGGILRDALRRQAGRELLELTAPLRASQLALTGDEIPQPVREAVATTRSRRRTTNARRR